MQLELQTSVGGPIQTPSRHRMTLLVNALSIGSMSGNHVVYGFLRPLAKAWRGEHRITVLHYESSPPPQDLLDQDVRATAVSERHRHWAKRMLWERRCFARVVEDTDADVVLSVSGALTPNCPVPQAVLCQNPWCFRPVAQRGMAERFKARLQRIGYGRAFRDANLMIYLSAHLRELYRNANVGRPEPPSEIAYVGLNENTFESARRLRNAPRDPYSILSVSAMASWKGADTLVDAIGILRRRDLPVRLRLVGPWPHPEYERQVRRRIDEQGLGEAVEILGCVSDEELHRQYAINQVYALPSHCESYGIPAAEAMAFGTPVVSTTCCAISEICEPAGLFGPAGSAEWTADAVQTLLTDQNQWSRFSAAARDRAATLSWDQCFRPLMKLQQLVADR